MSLNSKPGFFVIAKNLCREQRKNSTPAERIFWELVRNRKFCNAKFNRQYPIFFDYMGKETFYIADFCCLEKKLVVEVDGKIHAYRISQDKLRTETINSMGFKVIRFTNEQILNDLNYVKSELEDNINRLL